MLRIINIVLATFLFMTTDISATQQTNADKCKIFSLKLDHVRSKLKLALENYKINFKSKFAPQIMALKPGQKVHINLDQNPQFSKLLNRLVLTVASYEALVEDCNKLTTGNIKSPDKVQMTPEQHLQMWETPGIEIIEKK